MVLPPAVFDWLMNIRPEYLVYLPCRFARQFGYDQFLVGNPRSGLSCTGSLPQAARCWYYSIAGGTRARFILSHEGHTVCMSLGFCRWYSGANQTPLFDLKTSF